MAVNRKAIDIARSNINSGFSLAESLAGHKTLLRLWHSKWPIGASKFGNLSAQAEELRALSAEVTADVTAPIKARVTLT